MKALALLTAAAVTFFSVAHRTARAKRRPRRRLLPKASAIGGPAIGPGPFLFGPSRSPSPAASRRLGLSKTRQPAL